MLIFPGKKYACCRADVLGRDAKSGNYGNHTCSGSSAVLLKGVGVFRQIHAFLSPNFPQAKIVCLCVQLFPLFAHLVLGEGEPVLKLPEEEEHSLRTPAEELHETENAN